MDIRSEGERSQCWKPDELRFKMTLLHPEENSRILYWGKKFRMSLVVPKLKKSCQYTNLKAEKEEITAQREPRTSTSVLLVVTSPV